MEITGKDAFILSFVARNGVPTREERRGLEKYLTPHVVRAAFSASSNKRKGKKTLAQLKKLAKSNTYVSGPIASSSRRRVGLFRPNTSSI